MAHLGALKTIKTKSTHDKDRARADWALARAQAQHDPPNVTAVDLEQLAGSYGKSRVWIEGGQLRFQRENESPYLLVSLTRGVFTSETIDPIRIEFVRRADDQVKTLLFADEDGAVHTLAKIQ